MKVPVEQDTRSEQKFTKEKLATMRPGDIAAVASQRGYDVHPATGRISHDSFLKQQEDSDFYKGNEAHTESGDIPDDYVGKGGTEFAQVPNFRDVSSTGDSTNGGKGGLPPAEAMANSAGEGFQGEALGEAESTEEHSGEVSSTGSTLGTEGLKRDKEAPEGGDAEPLVNVPAKF